MARGVDHHGCDFLGTAPGGDLDLQEPAGNLVLPESSEAWEPLGTTRASRLRVSWALQFMEACWEPGAVDAAQGHFNL